LAGAAINSDRFDQCRRNIGRVWRGGRPASLQRMIDVGMLVDQIGRFNYALTPILIESIKVQPGIVTVRLSPGEP
jgi:hypothetical protein